MTETALKQTPLFNFHQKHNARLVPFAGWHMPIQYTSIVEEHKAVRNAAGLFDVSHMGEALVKGSQARAFLNHIMTNNIQRLKPGQAIYTLMCYEDGGCLDDVIVSCIGETEFLVCLNAANIEKDIAWMCDQSTSFECLIKDVSEEYAQLALQGPKAESILEEVTQEAWGKLRRFHFATNMIDGISVIISRTGYTGEDGFELFCASADVEDLANLIFEKGQTHGLQLAGLGARDSLRLEAGYPLYGHEISETISPIQAGLDWTVKLCKKNGFIGKEILEAQSQQGIDKKIVFFAVEDRRIARAGTPVFFEGKAIGEVVSETFSPMNNQPIGSALIDANKNIELSESKPYVEVRGTQIPLTIKKPPLYS